MTKMLVGRIESSENSLDIPIVVIDGKLHSWEEVEKMGMSYEGFQIQMEVVRPWLQTIKIC
ncbi:DUF7713 domain-containing protein [Oceanobacillus damuensis]|uniref:DUF7713 domain-containing protein n=1 Tax=Oceanobacillus damuensis TaxID=937928 RepID=UPI000AD0894D|nr:hypothetical protein [Oceanobacillus damuensis]